MTKVEMFHCAACKVYVSTSAADVHTHVTSQVHLSNSKVTPPQHQTALLNVCEEISATV